MRNKITKRGMQKTQVENPEKAYRRGYLQGAAYILAQIEAGELPARLRAWIDSDLHPWRSAQQHGRDKKKTLPPEFRG